MKGYHGKILIIDLSSQQIIQKDISINILKNFIGGNGLGTYLLYKYCPKGVDPFNERNPIIFVSSPLASTKITTSSKFAVLTKSPLTGFIGDSLSSSHLAIQLKKTGYDALIITGKSSYPLLLFINNNRVEFKNAEKLTGLSTSEKEKSIKKIYGNNVSTATIGPAGENLVRFASISNDGGRQAGRSGAGAVMGSKNLKGIAIIGDKEVEINNEIELEKIAVKLRKKSIGDSTEKYRNLGTIANINIFNRLGTLPSLNFNQSNFNKAENISGEYMHDNHFIKSAHCANCTIGCEKIMQTNDGKSNIKTRMEYESAYALGPLVGINDSNSVIRASHLCDEIGVDTISAGATIAWAIESFKKGLISLKDTNQVHLNFGDSKSVMTCLNLIAKRRGIGNLLAEGSQIASKLTGGGSEYWAMHVKGLEMPGYEPRSLKTMALGLAVSTRGACHNRSSAYEADFSNKVDRLSTDEEKGKITMDGEDISVVMDSMIICKFLRKSFDDFLYESSIIYKHITGIKVSKFDLKKSGERINNLKKMFNIREGWTINHDTLPKRILNEPIKTGIATGVELSENDLNKMIQSYYKSRGWTDSGLITKQKLRDLNLLEIVNK